MKKKLLIPISIIAVHLLLLGNIRFTAWPEMLAWPYLMINGWLPYKDIAIAHNPLLLVDLSIFYMLFGAGVLQLKIYTWILIILLDLVVYFVVRELLNRKAAFYSLLFLIPLSVYYEANGLWFDLMLALIYPLIFLYFKRKNYLIAGILFALAFLTKQTAVWILFPMALFSLKNRIFGSNVKNLIAYSEKFMLGVFSVILPFLFIVYIFNILPDYIFWAYKFAGGSLPFSEGQIVLPGYRQFILGVFPLLIAGAIAILANKKSLFELLIWAMFASFGVYPRWELFHFLPSLFFLAYIYSVGVENMNLEKWMKNINYRKLLQNPEKAVAFFMIIILMLFSLRKAAREWGAETRFYGQEVMEVSEVTDQLTEVGEKLFVLNAWDSYYALTGTIPATRPLVPQFSWYLSVPGVEEEMLSDLIIERPEYVIYHPYSEAGLDSFRPKIADYIDKYYEKQREFDNFDIYKKR